MKEQLQLSLVRLSFFALLWSVFSIQVAQAQTFTSFGSSSTSINSSLVINGTNLTETTSVKFGETPAKFTVNSSTQITATVPRVANSGPLRITKATGSVLSSAIPVTRQSSSNVFSALSSDFNSLNNIFLYRAPTFTDIDGDGLLDMLTGTFDGAVEHYEQNTANSTSFTLVSYLGLNAVGTYSKPTFTDLDGDGLLDVLVGEFDGTLNHYEQNAANSTSFTLRTGIFNSIDVGNYSAPTFTDLDGDGLLDMIVGEFSGNLNHYEQNAANSDQFTLITDNFNGIDVGGWSAPTFTDLDGDGLLDMVVGEQYGAIWHYEQNAANSTSFNLITANLNGINVNYACTPTFTDLDGDGLLDMLVGRQMGLYHFEQNQSPIISTLSANPTCQNATVSITGTDLTGATLVTINGTSVGTLSGVTANNITFTVPANAISGNVVVTTPNGTSNAVPITINFTFTSFGSTSTAMNSSLVITGTNLTGTTSVRFGETPAKFTVNSNTQITATVPRVANTGKISLTNSNGCQSLSISIPVTRQSSSNVFSSITTAFNTIDIGDISAPAFTDLDGDGLLDIIIGERYGTLKHYEQNAVNSTSFTLITSSFNGISVGNQSAPTFTDIDGDGLLDMIVGEKDGNLNHYEQNAANSTSFTLISANFNTIDIGDGSSPTFTDLDGDGLLDMIVGELSGNLNHYEQNAVNSTSFTLITANFNGIAVGEYSNSTFTDLDGDGLLDLIIGENAGNLNHYEQNATYSNSFTLITDNFNGISVGSQSSPTFTDLDGDGLLDMIIGEFDGNLNHYEQNQSPIISTLSANPACIGATVSITGTALTGATLVTINGISVGTLSGVTATNVTFTVPANATSGNVVVTTPNGMSNSVTLTINALTFTSFGSSSTSMNSSLVITGTNLTGTTSVRFGETPAKFTVNSNTQITATVPRVANTGKISLTNSTGCNSNVLSTSIPVTRQSSSNAFSSITESFNVINVGIYSAPTFTDLDGDGLLDMIVGEQDGVINHYEQNTTNSTSFSLITANFNAINVGFYSAPTFTDLDGDGLLDMIIGEFAGNLNHYEQNAANSTSFTLVTNNFNGIDIGDVSVPTFTDLDGDGLLDMIVGENDGTLNHYEQNATNSTSFTLITANFNAIDVGFYSTPTFTDLDGDGLLDLFIGEDNGSLNHYEQNAANSASFTLVNINFNGISVGVFNSPAFTDLDGDGLLDMIIGEYGGNLNHYEQNPLPIITSFTPASGSIGTLVTITGTDLNGLSAFTIGGVSAIAVSNTGTTLVGMVMPGAATAAVAVTTAGGSATSAGTFTVLNTPFPIAQQGTKLTGTSPLGSPSQGWSVALSADGKTALVSGYSDNSFAGATWVYTRSGNTWSQQAKLIGTGNTGNAWQGFSVALAADGNTAIIGGVVDASGKGAVWIFTRSGSTWSQQGNKLVASDEVGNAWFGKSVSLSADGNTALVGGYWDNSNAGAAWVFTRSGTTWTQQGNKMVGTGAVGAAQQGTGVSLSADGNTAAIGGATDDTNKGATWIFTRSGTTWTQQGNKLVGTGATGASKQGQSLALSADATTLIIGGVNATSNVSNAWVFTRSGTTWSQQGTKLVASDAVGTAPNGTSVSLTADGNTALMGSVSDNSNRGAAWVFTRSGATWTQEGNKLLGTGAVGSTLYEGRSVALSADGTNMLVGADGDATGQGAAWSYSTGVIYDGNGNTGGTIPSSALANIGSSVTLATNIGTLVKTGHTFAGWNTLANGTGTSYASGTSITLNGSLPLYAKWTLNNYMVTFDANGGNGGSMSTQSIAYLASANLTANTFIRTGYTFAGWATTTGGTVAYVNSASYTMSAAANVTLYAQWTAYYALVNYANTSITTAGGNTTVTPDAAPTGEASVTAHTTTDFKGLLTVNSISGVVTITNAHPAGSYGVTVDAGFGITKIFTLTVGNTACSQGQFYAPATPEITVGRYSQSVAIGDFNGDGKQDIAAANLGGSVSIRLGDGLGGFSGSTEVAVGANTNSIAIGDFNGDGKQDIATASSWGTVSIRLGDGLGGFSGTTEVAVGANPFSIAVGDFNGDGAPDFATANYNSSGTVSIRLGDGFGGFSGTSEIAVGANPRSVAIGDFNGDGKQDMAIANSGSSSSSVSIRLGDGLGGFSGTTEVVVTYYSTASTESVAIGDFNSDGKQDFASVDSYSGRVFIRLGDGLGGFSGNTNVAVGYPPKSVAIGDFNGDGKLDFATAKNNSSGTVSIRLGDGLGGFSGSTEFAVGTYPCSVAVGDFNGDGKQDIATANFNSSSVSIRLGGIGDINLKGNAVDIVSGDTTPSATDHTDFGSGGNTNTRTFTIQNTGIAPIIINTIGISGADATKFSISGIVLPISIAAGTEATFNIVSIDFSAALKTATITINNGDCGEVAYTFAIQAGSILPTLGVYSDATIANAGGSTLVTPSVIPSGTNFTAYTTTNFKGTLAVNNTTGVLSITNAHPAGNYTVTVNALGVLYNFTLTVGNTLCSQGQLYAPATPEVTVGTNPRSVAIGDFNGDGKQDMAIANYGVEYTSNYGSVSIRLGDGLGGFSGTTEVGVSYQPQSVAIGDFNGDGKQDFAANSQYDGVTIRLGDGLGGFSVGYNVAVGNYNDYGTVAIGDFNSDGKQDFACSNFDGKVFIRLGDGLGGFSGATELTVGSNIRLILISDFNNDGKQDILAVLYAGPISILLGDGSGGFGAATNTGSYSSWSIYSNAVALGDFNGDGNQDFVVSNVNASTSSTSFYIYLGNGLGGFTPGPVGMAKGGTANNVAVGDFNGDGIQDIATTVNSGSVIIYLGDNTGLFKAITPSIAVGANPSSLAIGDFDGDGKQDVVTTNYDGGTISIRLTPNQAEINLKANTIAIPNGNTSIATADNTDFGNGFNTTLAYTIQNTGTGALTIKSIGISGTDAALFTKSGITLPATIAAGSETTFNLSCNSASLGIKTATVRINNDDCDEGAYTFNVQATSLLPTLGNYAAATLPTAGGNATITPSAAPTNNGLGITAKTSVDFKGKLTVDAATGAVRITNANPAGTYQITVNAGIGVSQTFALTVGNPLCSQGQFLSAASLNVGLNPSTAEVADFNNDGYQDFAVALGNTKAVSIQLGNGSGGYTTVTTLTFSENTNYLTINDFNGDGNADLVVKGVANLYIRLGNGLGGVTTGATIPLYNTIGCCSTSYIIGSQLTSILSEDIDQDGKIDLVVTGTLGFAVFKGNGQGGFSLLNTYNNGILSYYIEKGDFNGDGFTDLSMGSPLLGNNYIYFGNGNGGFGDATIYNLGAAIRLSTIGDFNGDGKSDILSALGNTPGTVAFQKNNGDGTFATPTYIAVGDNPFQVVSGDFNGDGKLDFATGNMTLKTVSVRYGNGDGTFYGATELQSNALATALRLIVGDFNTDGIQDIGTASAGITTDNFSVFLGASKEINLQGNGQNIVSGDNTPDVADATDFGTINSYTPSTKTYTIENTGTGLLNITNIALSGLDASSYFVGGITLPATIAAGATTTFTVTVNAVTIGTKTATVTINNDDCDERAYTFSVKAAVLVNTTTFNSTWRTTAANESVTIPIWGSAITINWGDGSSTTAVNNPLGANNPTHTYSVAGDYAVVISGSYDRTFFDWGNNSEAKKIISINQWGTNAWTSMENAFFGCENLSIIAADVPVLTNVTSMRLMFFATNISGNLNNWDVSTISDMSIMFSLTNAINLTISNWNVSSVSNMDEMFSSATNIPDISSWDVSNVTSMREMFYYTSNIPDLSSWNVSQVIDMHRMFFIASGIPDISSWDVGNVTNMGSMFRSSDFNQDIGSWNVSFVTDMSGMFYFATVFNQNVGSWNVRNVNDMSGMFSGVTLSITNYDALLMGWAPQINYPYILFDGGNSKYCAGASARQSMIDYGWTITDGGKNLAEINLEGNSVAINSLVSPTAITDFGKVALNSSVTRTFTITNPGGSQFTISSGIYVNGTDAALFSVSNLSSNHVAGGASVTYDVTFTPTTVGNKTASLSISHDDGIASIADINIQGKGVVSIATAPSVSNDTDFGTVSPNAPVTKTYTIQNTGSDPLLVNSIDLTGTNAANFVVGGISLPATIAAGTESTFTLKFTPTTVGLETATVAINTNVCAISSYTFAVQGSGSCVAATWTGSISTAWNTPGNWSCGIVPNATSDVTIAAATNQPVLSTNVSIHTLTLEAVTTMTVPTGLNLTVSNYIHNAGTLTVANNANLIQVDDVANTGNVVVYRDSAPIVRLDHTLWSSPVDSQNLFTFSPATLTNRFYTYDTSSNAYTNVGLNANSTFIVGKGFAVRAPNNQTAVTPTAWQGTFTGVPNNGTIPFTLNTSTPGYNLVGNPYPSTIDAATFIAANPNIVGTLYFYAHSLSMDANGVFPSGTNYAVWNSLGSTAATHILNDVHFVPVAPSGTIQVGQGFFVKATGAGTINFTNTMRVADNDNQSFRTKAIEKDRLWLDLKTETGTNINQILVGYITGATQGIDRNYDGLSFGNTGSYLSSKIAKDDYAIQGRSQPFDSSDEVPLGFKAATAGNYSITLSKSDGLFAGNQEVFLKDNLTGITHNIKGSSYSFTSQSGTFDTRFSLVYAKTLGVDANSLSPNSVQVYKDGEWFRVKTNGITMQEVSVYDLAGRLIYKQSGINDTTTLLEGLSQVQETMLVKIVSQENQSVTVKVIN